MKEGIILIGVAGAVGRVLGPQLVAAGYRVFGATRRTDRLAPLASLGIEPLRLDAFDADAVLGAVEMARPTAIFNQLTDLPCGLLPDQINAAAEERNAEPRLRQCRQAKAVCRGSAFGARCAGAGRRGGPRGIFNVVEGDFFADGRKMAAAFGWRPAPRAG